MSLSVEFNPTWPYGVEERAKARFDEANALEAAGRFDEAFAAFEAANAICRDALGSSARQTIQFYMAIEEVKRRFNPTTTQRVGKGDVRTKPIFVVGMPRSGSTLIEQILDTHPAVVGMGEPFVFSRLAILQGEEAAEIDPLALATAYLAEIAALGWDRRRRFVDKSLFNFLLVGAIHRAFPNATILHSMRDPADTCWACYRAFFGNPGLAYCYDLVEAGRYFVAYRGLMEHWTLALPGGVIPVRYEALVTDPEAQIRRLLEVCGLPWHEGCLRFFENRRVVDTPSRDQVRQPIYTSSIGRWRPYRAHLKPLFDALEHYAPQDDQAPHGRAALQARQPSG